MHESMYSHPIVQENITKLQKLGVDIILPRVEENKAKLALTEEIVSHVVSKLTPKQDLDGLSFILTAGPCREYLDPVRFVSNPSTGRMGIALAQEIYRRGGSVSLILGKTSEPVPSGITIIPVETSEDYFNAVKTEINKKIHQVFISTAAICDFKPTTVASNKIKSDDGNLTIQFSPTPKIIKTARTLDKDLFIVAFKAESNLSTDELIDRAHKRLVESKANLMVANDVGREQRGFESSTNEIFIINKKKNITHVPLSSKKQCSVEIITQIKKAMKLK